jgi:hypothetical protein
MIVRMKRRKAEEAGTGRRGPTDRRSMEDQMRIAVTIVTLMAQEEEEGQEEEEEPLQERGLIG